MSTAGRSEDAPDRAAAVLGDADFVRLVATADGDALAATGLLARALETREVPYQTSLAAVPDPPATGADCTVAVGHSSGEGDATLTIDGTPLSLVAADVASDLAGVADGAVDPVLALAGAVAAGAEPSGRWHDAADLDRRPGVAVPTEDPVEGLGHSTLVHAGFSGDGDPDGTLRDGDDGRALASAVALATVEDAPPRAAEAVERALRPSDTDSLETLGGLADVLDALARTRPGTGVALALGHDVAADALDAWRDHGRRAHGALRGADANRFDGAWVLRVDDDAPLGTVARLGYEFRSPEPVVVAVRDGEAAVAGGESAGEPFRSAAAFLHGRVCLRRREGVTALAGAATFDGTADEYVEAFRGKL